MKKTLIRILTGVFLIGLLVLCLHLGDIVFLLIFGAFFLITVREMDHLIKAMGKEIVITPASIFAGFFGIVYYLTSYNLSVVFAFGLLMVVATVVGQVLLMRRHADREFCTKGCGSRFQFLGAVAYQNDIITPPGELPGKFQSHSGTSPRNQCSHGGKDSKSP